MKTYTLDDAQRLVLSGQCRTIHDACVQIMAWCKHGHNKASIGVIFNARN